MKKTLLFVFAIALMAIRSQATIHHIVASDNFTFTPSSLNVALGDTILWELASGTAMNHTTTSTSVPSGAATWNSPLNPPSGSFMYKPTVVGTYNYQCNFHVSLGMTGSFTVTSNAAVGGVANVGVNVYPNPASSNVNLQFTNAAPTSVAVMNLLGSVVYRADLFTRETSLNVKDLPNGTYIVNISHGDIVYKHELLIAH